MNGPASALYRRMPRMLEGGVDHARVTRVVVQSENKLCNTCVRAENSSARPAPQHPRGTRPGRNAPPRVYDRSRVTVVFALYPGSGQSRALTHALITAWSQ